MEYLDKILFFFFALLLVTIMFLLLLFYGSKTKYKKDSFTNSNKNNKDQESVASFLDYNQPLSVNEKIDSLYSPIVCRPPERSGKIYGGQCTNELYPMQTSPYGKGMMVSPCNPEIEAKYYAQRPLLAPETYHEMLQLLFNQMQDPIPKKVPIDILQYPQSFCNDKIYSNVMKFLMKKVKQTMKNNKVFQNYAKADTWGGEQFAYLYQKIFCYSSFDSSGLSAQEEADMTKKDIRRAYKLIIAFTLYNTLRSVSTDVVATVFYFKGKYYLANIEFATQKPNSEGVQPISIMGQAKKDQVNLNNADIPVGDKPEWIYYNTIENKYFTPEGYHSPHKKSNLFIAGSVPPQYGTLLKKFDQGYLSKPSNGYNRFKGGPLYPSDSVNQTTSKITPNFSKDKENHFDVYV